MCLQIPSKLQEILNEAPASDTEGKTKMTALLTLLLPHILILIL